MIYLSTDGELVEVAPCGSMRKTRSVRAWAREDLQGLLDHTRAEGARALAAKLKDHIDSGMAASELYAVICRIASNAP